MLDDKLKPEERLIIALDFDNEKDALDIVDRLKDRIKTFKVGSELYTACGPKIVNDIHRRGCRIFLDLKHHDIPNTAARSAALAARLGVFMLNVHASGGAEMMAAAAEAIQIEARKHDLVRPKLIAVTVLTSLDKRALKKIGIDGSIERRVLLLARLAKRCGLDGVVSSPGEAAILRKALGEDFLIVTPGVRPAWGVTGDQKRIATPRKALESGASYIVVGRPVTAVENPVVACERIIEELKECDDKNSPDER